MSLTEQLMIIEVLMILVGVLGTPLPNGREVPVVGAVQMFLKSRIKDEEAEP